jgi:hypothetical protein
MLDVRFWGEPDMERLTRPAKSVENDPWLKKRPAQGFVLRPALKGVPAVPSSGASSLLVPPVPTVRTTVMPTAM